MNRVERLNELLVGLCFTFQREFQPLIVQIYDKALEDLSIEEIEFAVNRWVSVLGKKFPTPVDLREVLSGDLKSRSQEALQLLVNAMEQSGAYKSVAFEDTALMATIDQYHGWAEICQQYRDLRQQDLSYWEHQFRESYQSCLKMNRTPKARYLPGLFELHNVENSGTFTRGKLPEPEVEFYGKEGKLRRLELAEFNRKQLKN